MRLARILSLSVLYAATLAPPAGADGLRWGANGISRTTTNLGPIGNGRRDFLEFNCYVCHGGNGAGGEGPNVQHAPGSLVSDRVMNGGALGMRSFKKYIGAKGIKELTAYLASIGTKKEPTWVDWWNPVPGAK
ncbi:MAG: hypothetical protein WDN04_22860 [Rhodospirillales bacterium]